MDFDKLNDEQLLAHVEPLLEELSRRGMLCVMIHLRATAIAPAKDVFAFPDPEDVYSVDETAFISVSEGDFEIHPDEIARHNSVANKPTKPRPVS
jgi:hypothetical protein